MISRQTPATAAGVNQKAGITENLKLQADFVADMAVVAWTKFFCWSSSFSLSGVSLPDWDRLKPELQPFRFGTDSRLGGEAE